MKRSSFFLEELVSWSIVNMIDFTQRIVVQDEVEQSRSQYNRFMTFLATRQHKTRLLKHNTLKSRYLKNFDFVVGQEPTMRWHLHLAYLSSSNRSLKNFNHCYSVFVVISHCYRKIVQTNAFLIWFISSLVKSIDISLIQLSI